jgi:hypothetical protein
MTVKTVLVGPHLRCQIPLRKERLLSPPATRVYGPPSMKQVPKHLSKAGESSSPSAFLRNANTTNLARPCSPKSLASTVDDHSGCVLDPSVQAGTKRRILNGGVALSYGRVTGLAMEMTDPFGFPTNELLSRIDSQAVQLVHATGIKDLLVSAGKSQPSARMKLSAQ